MSLRNTAGRYGAVAKAFHWSIAVLLIAMLVLGWVMTGLDPFSGSWLGLSAFTLYQFHKSLGLTVMVLAALRLAWRFTGPVPALPVHMKDWEARAAHLTHLALYGALVGMPLTGWLMVSASTLGLPTLYFGLFEVPHLVGPDERLESLFKSAHEILSILFVGSLVLHITGALKHHFVERDDVLRRMLPGR